MLAASRPEAVREPEKVRFVDRVQHRHRRPLDDLVLQRRDTERPLPPVGFGDVHPTNRSGPVRAPSQPFGQILEVTLQRLAVGLPRRPVYAGGGVPLQREVGRPQRVRVVDVVEERGELRLPILARCLTYPLERAAHVAPAQGPGRVLLGPVPLGQAPSLHPLRRRSPGFVRRLPWYSGPVRLPAVVHHRRMPLGFPTRPTAPSAVGNRRISRFPRRVFPYVLGVFDRAEPASVSRCRRCRRRLPQPPTASALRRDVLSRLDTRPARTPVNASTSSLRTAPHDSGPVWLATPSLYDSFIHNTLPV